MRVIGLRQRRPAVVALSAAVLAVTMSAAVAVQPSAAATPPVHAAATAHYGWIGKGILADAFLDGISCPTASLCVSSGGLTNNDSLIETSTNGGATWSSQAFTSTANIGSLDNVTCVDATHCMATGGGTGGTAFWTTDGSHWNQSTLPGGNTELNSVSCVSDTTCYAASFDGAGLQTTDFGQTWTALNYLTTDHAGTPISAEAIYFQSPTVGFVVSVDSSCSSAGCAGHIQNTSDGGTTWNFDNTPQTMSGVDTMTCTSALDCVALGADSKGMIPYVSTDDGVSWTASTHAAGGFPAGKISCPDTKDCYAGGAEDYLYSSTGANEDSTGVVFRSTDGGSNWTLQQTSNGVTYVDGVSCTSATVCFGAGSTFENKTQRATIASTTNGGVPPRTGYYFVASDGGIFAYGNAHFYGSTGGIHLNKPVVGMAVNSTSGGYWLVASDGGIFTFGNAHFYGSTGNIHLTKPIVGMAIDPATGGYWMVAADGGIFAFNAPFYGSEGGKAISAPIDYMVSRPDGSGYYLVARDGTVYAFGSAAFGVCTGKAPGAGPTVATSLDRVAGGYWEVDAQGQLGLCHGVPFYGDLRNVALTKPVISMAATPDGGGYWMVAADGGVFAFGDAHFYGSTGNIRLAQPVVAMATVPAT
jgi:hypothetical protein